ncbi:MAG: PaaI family thioesterase, partial [Alphaproteobacteria bacterium]|nr:PaaI family thioesterase [Alphaproteobacteria bacterium]
MNLTVEGLRAEGWRELRSSGFTTAIGQVLFRTDRGAMEACFIAPDSIGNDNAGGDVVHGGAMMTFADIVLGFAAAKASGNPCCVTVQMTYQFVGAARFGDFVNCRAEIVRVTNSLVFARGLVRAGDQ